MIKSFSRGTSCGRDDLHAQHLMDCLSGVVVAISNDFVASITQVVNLFLDGKCPKMLGKYIASAPLTPLVKRVGGIRPIDVGTIWRHLVSKLSAAIIGHSLDGYLNDMQFGVGVSGGGEAILHVVNRLIEDRGDDVGLSMLLVDFKNAFNLVDKEVMLQEVRIRCPAISRWVEFCYSSPARLYYGEHTLRSYQGVQQGDPLGPLLFALVLHPLVCKIRDSFNLSFQAWYLDDGTIIGDTLVVGEVLKIIMEDEPRHGLHLNVDKTEGFWPDEDPRHRFAVVFQPNIARPFHDVKLLGGPASADIDFSSELVMKSVAKSIELIDVITEINDSKYELLLLRASAGISKLYFAMRTCLPRVFKRAQLSFDAALRSALERIITASSPRFGDLQWRHFSLPFAFERLSVYYIDLLSNPSEVAAPKLMKKLADIYFTRVTQTVEYTFSISVRQMALSKSQIEDHTSDWLRVVLIAGCSLILYQKSKLQLALWFLRRRFRRSMFVTVCSIVGIKHRHNIVCDTLVDIGFWSAILAGKEVDIGFGGGRDKPLRPADMLLYSWDGGLDVCVDLTGLSSLTQTGMIDFAPGQAVFEAAQRKRTKYEAKCAGWGIWV
ncbi:putative reverse transcriptase domain-containing protein [Tanacetum coccineum]